MSNDDFEEAIRDLSQLPEIADCWSLLIAESGKNRINTLAQLLILTSIVEREFSHICALRQGYGRSVTSAKDAKLAPQQPQRGIQQPRRALTSKR